jgi:hypothetical protein
MLKQDYATLQAAGVATTLHVVPGGHAVNDEMRAIGRRWLDEVAREK